MEPVKIITEGKKKPESERQRPEMVAFFYQKLGMGLEIGKVIESIVRINQDISELGLIKFDQYFAAAISNPDKISNIIEYIEKR